jgi:hypothetical protein
MRHMLDSAPVPPCMLLLLDGMPLFVHSPPLPLPHTTTFSFRSTSCPVLALPAKAVAPGMVCCYSTTNLAVRSLRYRRLKQENTLFFDSLHTSIQLDAVLVSKRASSAWFAMSFH